MVRVNKKIDCFVGLGSNLNYPAWQINKAQVAIAQLKHTELIKIAPWYTSKAVGPGIQNPYINTVVHIKTCLHISVLLSSLQQIEQQHLRKRTVANAPRTLDLDILAIHPLSEACNDIDSKIFHTYTSQYLELPHPRIAERQFILKPWCELASQLYIPSLGHKLSDLCKHCPDDESLNIYAHHEHSS